VTATLESTVVRALPEGSLLGTFNRAGVLAPADVHVACRLGRLGGDDDPLVTLAAAFAVRAPRLGHVRVDLHAVRTVTQAEGEDEAVLDALAWPEPDAWTERVARSPLVAVGDDDATVAPLRLVGSALYLDRNWRDEQSVAADLLARAGRVADGDGRDGATSPGSLQARIDRLVGADGDAEQRWAVALAALRGLAVIAGGPGTGKTTTVARTIGVLAEEALDAGRELPLVALAAPTGKAANRLQDAVRAAAAELDLSPSVRGLLGSLGASTVHRLLRPRPDNTTRFRYHRRNRLPHDLVIVDETSMMSLWLMARLLEAVRLDAHVVLVGDPEQLASVEAGAVLGDIVGPASSGLRMGQAASAELAAVTGVELAVERHSPDGPVLGDGIVVLRTNHRFAGGLADLADAVRSGNAEAALAALGNEAEDSAVRWLPIDAGEAEPHQLEPVRTLACEAAGRVVDAARAGDGDGALAALGSWRVLCAHRRGPAGVSTWNASVERWLAEEIGGFSASGEWYVGRPVIVTANDYRLRLFNGDAGVVVVAVPSGIAVTFEQGPFSPSRLSQMETVYAMTVHKAQGTEFEQVVVVLPEPTSRILTRELLYTAVTRAKSRLLLVGTEDAVRAAVDRPISRASGLTERLWGG
jgi:exodeoxyribonuclease V alpha subunit